jgi:hypothetical protein
MRDTLGRLELRIVDLLTMRASGEAANRDVFVPGGAMGWDGLKAGDLARKLRPFSAQS